MDTSNTSQTGAFPIEFLRPEDCRFYINQNGFTALEYRGEDYRRVRLVRSLPLKRPEEYISVTNMDKKEIGIIRCTEDFSAEQREIIERDLRERYYCPVITEVLDVKSKMGFYYFDVSIDGFKKTFAVKDISRNIKQLDNGAVMFTDADGNRFLIEDLTKVKSKSRRQIEPFLY